MDPSTRLQIDIRLQEALEAAGRSALGMPTAVEPFRAWLAQAGLELALTTETTERARGVRFRQS